jgi:hypothetical protein
MKTPSRTTNPLHFEDLEPHRFEDLVRQLIYEFKAWKSLEATGRSGSDEGFDVRGFEVVDTISTAESDLEEEKDEENQDVAPPDRLWLIQCKRERAISPKKLGKYSGDIKDSGIDLRLWLFTASTYAFRNSASKHGVHSPPVSPPSPCGK